MEEAKLQTGESLKNFRDYFGYSQKLIADKVGVMPQAYYRYESGRISPPSEIIIKIAKEFNVSADYLLGLTDEPRPLDEEKPVVIENANKLMIAAKNENILGYHQELSRVLAKQGIKI